MLEANSESLDDGNALESKVWSVRLAAFQDLLADVQTADQASQATWLRVQRLPQLLNNESNPKILDVVFAILERSVSQIVTWKQFVNSFCAWIASKAVGQRHLNPGKAVMVGLFRNGCSENVTSALLEGSNDKNPKKCASCFECLAFIVQQEGISRLNVNKVLSHCLKRIEHRDGLVREACRNVIVEVGARMGSTLEGQLADVNSIQRTEILTAIQRRLAESQNSEVSEVQEADAVCSALSSNAQSQRSTEYLDIGTLLPENFEKHLASKNWEDRLKIWKTVFSTVNGLSQSGKRYNVLSLVPSLNDALSNENNVKVLEALCSVVTAISPHLDRKNSRFSLMLLSTLLPKFKEKKANVVAALIEAVDVVLDSLSFELSSAAFIQSLNVKSASVKAQTAMAVYRYLLRLGDVSVKIVKPILQELLKMCDNSDVDIRDAALQAVAAVAVLKRSNHELNGLIQQLSSDRQRMNKLSAYMKVVASQLKPSQVDSTEAKNELPEPTSCSKLLKPVSENNAAVRETPRNSTPKDLNEVLPQNNVTINMTFSDSISASFRRLEDQYAFHYSMNNDEISSERDLPWTDEVIDDQLVETFKQRMTRVCKCRLYSLLWTDNRRFRMDGLERLFEFLKCKDPGLMQNRNVLLKWCIVQMYNDDNAGKMHLRLLDLFDALLTSFADEPNKCSANSLVMHLLRLLANEAREVRVKIRKILHTLFTVMSYPLVLPYVFRMCKEASTDLHLAECLACILYILRVGVLPLEILEQIPGFVMMYTAHPNSMVHNVVRQILAFLVHTWSSLGVLEELTYDDRLQVEETIANYKKWTLIDRICFTKLEHDHIFMADYPKMS